MPRGISRKQKEKSFDYILFITVIIMLALGIVMVLSASSPSSIAEGENGYSYLKTQGLAAIGGLILMYIISKYDYKKYKKFDKLAFWITIFFLLSVRIPGLGHESGGAWRWIWLIPGRITFQPSEFAKIALVIFFASYLTDNRDKLRRKKRRILDTIVKVSSSSNFNINSCAKPLKCICFNNTCYIYYDDNGRMQNSLLFIIWKLSWSSWSRRYVCFSKICRYGRFQT